MNWKAIIVEDEPAATNLLKNILREHFPDVKVLAEAVDVAEAVERIELLQPDLVFLDIELRDGTVFEVLDQLKSFRGQLIFTTGHDEFALRAYRYNAIDYLLKPISPDVLKAVMDRLKDKEMHAQLRFEMLRESVQNEKFDKIILNVSEEYRVIPLKDIVRLEGDGNYTSVKLASTETVLTSKSLKFYEETLPGEQFFRLHQSHIINSNFIRKVAKGDMQSVLLENGESVPISRRKKDDFIVWLGQR